MNSHKAMKVAKIFLIGLVAVTVFGFVVKGLWNALIPEIFGWHMITFWQAIGLIVLSKILFGGFHRHGGGDRRHWKNRMKERWESMSPEEREKFQQGMRCGRRPFATPVGPQA